MLRAHGAEAGSSRWVDRLFDERDAALVGAALLINAGVLDAREARGFGQALSGGYGRAEEDAPCLALSDVATA